MTLDTNLRRRVPYESSRNDAVHNEAFFEQASCASTTPSQNTADFRTARRHHPRLLLTHFSGMPPDIDLVRVERLTLTGVQKALTAQAHRASGRALHL